MAIQEELVTVRERYVRETECRMRSLAKELQAIVLAKSHCMDTVLMQVREQEEAGRYAGFESITRLCQQMRTCLLEAHEGLQTPLPIAAKAMLAVCRSIAMHATSIDKRVHHAHGSNVLGKTHTMAGNRTSPDATFSSPYAAR